MGYCIGSQMEQSLRDNVYDSESGDKNLSELFTGTLSLAEALNKLRTRLLDLSARNRLLNYRHPKRRSIQFVDEPDLDSVFTRLIDVELNRFAVAPVM